MPEFSEEEAKLLESLEQEGLLSKDVASRVRWAMRIANAAGRKRFGFFCTACFLVMTAILWSGATAAWNIDWLRVLLFSLSPVTIIFAIITFVSTVEHD